MLRLAEVRKVFHAGKPNECIALDAIDLRIEPGKITAFTGPSGSGKTTLLTLVGCMARPTAGRIWLDGKEVTSLPERFLTAVRRRTFGFIFQQFNLIKGLSVLENVLLPAYPDGEAFKPLRERALMLLDLFGLSQKALSHVEWLSGGEAQRTAIARALINNPEVVIADEPTAHLDSKLSLEFMATMQRLNQEGRTVLLASHDPIVFESGMVDRLVMMRDGRIEDSRS
jgi:putative ABC transport system ATP-binding protein